MREGVGEGRPVSSRGIAGIEDGRAVGAGLTPTDLSAAVRELRFLAPWLDLVVVTDRDLGEVERIALHVLGVVAILPPRPALIAAVVGALANRHADIRPGKVTRAGE